MIGPTRKLALLASLALALAAVAATAAFATSPDVDLTETATVITVNGADPLGNYAATSTAVTLTSVATSITCASNSTFTIQVDGTGAITQLEFVNCNNGCVVNDVATAGNSPTPVTITDGGFTITGDTVVTSRATFRLDGTTATVGGTTGEIAGTVACTQISLDCRFTTPTGTSGMTVTQGPNTGTVPFVATVYEGAPGTLVLTNATVDGDTMAVCPNPDMTGTYTLDDPTTAGADDLTVSP